MNIYATCSCGSVCFESRQKPLIELCCHCTDCQAASNRDFLDISFFRVSDVDVSGEVKSFNFVADSGNPTTRDYCPSCNELMFDRSAGFPTLIGVIGDRFKKPFISQPRCHVWLSSKREHVQIPEGVTTHLRGFS